MQPSYDALTLVAAAPVDLQMHTNLSDGTWAPADLLDHAKHEGFGLIAITDHERVDTAAQLQVLARQRQMPLLVAAEITAAWQGRSTDVLCIGFRPEADALARIARDLIARQCANTQKACVNLQRQGHITLEPDTLAAILAQPTAQQPHEIARLLKDGGKDIGDAAIGPLLKGAGFTLVTADIAAVVDAVHQSGGVALIAHPGRGGGDGWYDEAQLDALRRAVPIDGLEVYYPLHPPEKVAAFADYAERHHLLVSAGSDSHGPDNPPIKYPAHLCLALLERLGVRIAG